jgi:hypothetical protein
MNDLKWTISQSEDPDRLSRWSLDQYKTILAAADLLREEIRQWQEAQGIEPEDSVETLNRLRMERDDEILIPLSSQAPKKIIRRNSLD